MARTRLEITPWVMKSGCGKALFFQLKSTLVQYAKSVMVVVFWKSMANGVLFGSALIATKMFILLTIKRFFGIQLLNEIS